MIKKVLIVDDNSTNLYMLETLLKGYGFEVTSAENGKDALDKARLNPPDLIVTDILMPVMDGYALCREWKSDDTLKHIPLVFYTATYTEPKDEEFALSLGADRFILKPQEPDIFMNMLKEVLEEKYTARQVVTKPLGEEMEFFRQHNEILFKKLEKKMSDLEIANQKLRILEERYRLSFENVTDVIYTIDTDLNILSISPSVERILGYKPQDFIGRPVSDLGYILTPESFEQAIADISLILKGETIPATIYRFIAKDGTIKYGEVSGSPIMREGKIIGIISVARDITDRKRAEEALNKALNFQQQLIDALPVPIFYKDSEGRYLGCNRAFEQFFGQKKEQVTGKSVYDISPKELADIYHEQDMALLQSQKTQIYESSVKDTGGVVHNVIFHKATFPEIDGSVGGLIGAILDITERKRAEKELLASRDMLIRSEKLAAVGQLAAGVAHEILNPINIIDMKLQIMEMDEDLSEKVREGFKTCHEQVKRVTKISSDLNQFARVTEKNIRPVNLNELIEQVLNLMGPRLKFDDIKKDLQYQPDLPLVPMDKDRIGQVILNLINNAIDAMKSRPERVLRVVTEFTDKNVVRFSFSDTGTGIPQEILSRIFDPFFTTKEEGKGTGLGLSISYRIIQDHGGRIWVENRKRGGATFIVELLAPHLPDGQTAQIIADGR